MSISPRLTRLREYSAECLRENTSRQRCYAVQIAAGDEEELARLNELIDRISAQLHHENEIAWDDIFSIAEEGKEDQND